MLEKEDRAPLLHGGHDRGEVVVGQDHVGGFFGHIGAGDAHGDTDVGLLERRRVVDPIAGHRHHVTVLPERLHQAQFVFRADPRIDRDITHQTSQG